MPPSSCRWALGLAATSRAVTRPSSQFPAARAGHGPTNTTAAARAPGSKQKQSSAKESVGRGRCCCCWLRRPRPPSDSKPKTSPQLPIPRLQRGCFQCRTGREQLLLVRAWALADGVSGPSFFFLRVSFHSSFGFSLYLHRRQPPAGDPSTRSGSSGRTKIPHRVSGCIGNPTPEVRLRPDGSGSSAAVDRGGDPFLR